MSALPNFNPRLRATGAPVTLALIGALIATFLLAWFGLRDLFGADLALLANSLRTSPWTLVTYPFANMGDGTGLLWMLLTLLWLWWAGATLEREMGSGRFALCWFTATVAGGLLASAGALLAGVQFVLLGPMLPLSAITMMWGARNPEARIMLMMIIPFKGSWLAALTAALVVFGYGTYHPLIGFFAVITPVLFWLWASNRIPFLAYSTGYRSGQRVSRGERLREQKRHTEWLDAIESKKKERDERERLRQLFERSLITDPEEDDRR